MKGAVPKTGHQTLLNRTERLVFRILDACKHAGLLREWQPEHIENHGSRHPRIELWPHTRTGWEDFSFELRMLYSDGTRFITGVLGMGITLDQLRQALEAKLAKTGLAVVIKGQGEDYEPHDTTDVMSETNHLDKTPSIGRGELDMAKELYSSNSTHNGAPDKPATHTVCDLDLVALDPDGSDWAFCEIICDEVTRIRKEEARVRQMKADCIVSLRQVRPSSI